MKSTGCVLDWRGGTRDWSRYHHTLTEHNTIPVRGVNGEAREFNGVDAYIDCGNDPSVGITDAITIEMIVKIAAKDSLNSRLIRKDTTGYMIQKDGTEKIYFDLATGDTAPRIEAADWNANEWLYIVGTYDKNAGANNYIVYLNSITKSIKTGTGVIATNTFNLYIGCRRPVDVDGYFNGTIDNVKIYNRALTPLEIWNNYVTMKPYVPLSESPVAIV